MKTLISGQSITIDDHGAGKETKDWGKGLHIHKRMQKDRYSGANIRIPLDNEEDLDISSYGKEENRIRLINEIKKAFSDRKKVSNLVKDLLDILSNLYEDDLNIEYLRESAKRIANHFDLKEKIKESFLNEVENQINSYISIHSDEDGNMYSIQQSKNNIIIQEHYSRVCFATKTKSRKRYPSKKY